ncbi:MAG: hypothetical protein WC648_01225 [Candidatus Paceibacterota bacterium]|jgi:hypothetical protein
MLVAEKICTVDRTESKYIQNPYQTAPTAVVQAVVGTYATAAFTTTEDALTVADEVYCAEHIYDFEAALAHFDLFAARVDDMTASVATAIDKYVLNVLVDAGTGAYTTLTGGFTTAANWNVILANLLSKFAGYADNFRGMYLVVENTDLVGIVQSQMASGFNFADAALNNGLVSNQAGIEIYVVRSGTFASYTPGSYGAVTNSGHRMAGIKGISIYAAPRGIQYEEKSVSAKTGKEVVVWGYIGAKTWAPKLGLVIDITIA